MASRRGGTVKDEREHIPADGAYKRPRVFLIEHRTKPEYLLKEEAIFPWAIKREWTPWWQRYRTEQARDQALASLLHKSTQRYGVERLYEFRAADMHTHTEDTTCRE